MLERLQKCLQLLLRGQDHESVNFFFGPLCDEGQFVAVDLENGNARVHDSQTGEETNFVRFSIGIEEVKPTETDPLCDAIRDQLVGTMREELHNCPDPLMYVSDPELEEMDVFWDRSMPDGLVLNTDMGKFRVAVAVTKIG